MATLQVKEALNETSACKNDIGEMLLSEHDRKHKPRNAHGIKSEFAKAAQFHLP